MKKSILYWLSNLEVFSCPSCNKDTIFKDGCTECERKVSDTMRIDELIKEIEQSHKDIVDITKSIVNKQSELKELLDSVKE